MMQRKYAGYFLHDAADSSQLIKEKTEVMMEGKC